MSELAGGLSLWLSGLIALTPGPAQVGVAAEGSAFRAPGLGPRGDLVAVEFEPGGVSLLVGQDARRQLVVNGVYSSGQRHDLTASVTYAVDKPNVLRISSEGIVYPTADGEATITARDATSGKSVAISLKTERCGEELPVNFVNEIVPTFTRLGCNAGGCHGKADGQNGFRLSLLGFYPEEDYEFLIHESRGRRVFPADPEFSLLLTKPANQLPHGGGKRMSPGSYEWEAIARWIRQGMPYGQDSDPVIQRIQVIPAVREMAFDSRQQLAVVGHYSDGSARDVTQLASFESNQIELASADNSGRVSVSRSPGEAAIMVRFQGQVDVFRAIIPQGISVPTLPPVRSFIDQAVQNRWRQLGIPPSKICDDPTFL